MKKKYIVIVCLLVIGCESSDRYVNGNAQKEDVRQELDRLKVQTQSTNDQVFVNEQDSIILPTTPYPSMKTNEEIAQAEALEEVKLTYRMSGAYFRSFDNSRELDTEWTIGKPAYVNRRIIQQK
ncbi:hypothetical protein FACS1894122_01050 [Alphaproteobacteria bacterium]|nr:hypothetical protein FACS1894122_01050 [Alphaproteobacteria bacterium]